MDNFLELLNNFSNLSNNNSNNQNQIPKEISDQYPYGEFPIRYTKSGQESIRKSSENRYSYSEPVKTMETSPKPDMSSISILLPLIQMLSGQKKQPKDMFQLLSKLLFKDNPEMSKLFQMIPQIKGQEINNSKVNDFDTNKVNISSLQKID